MFGQQQPAVAATAAMLLPLLTAPAAASRMGTRAQTTAHDAADADADADAEAEDEKANDHTHSIAFDEQYILLPLNRPA